MPINSHLFLGTVYENEKKVYQSVVSFYYSPTRLIINFYVKNHRLPFGEYTPKFIKKFLQKFTLESDLTQKIFGLGRDFSRSKKKIGVQEFELESGFTILPQICSEFFCASTINCFLTKKRADKDKQFVIFLFVNDSWFIKPFRQWMQNYAILKAACIQIPTIYVGHFECRQLLR